MKRKPVRETLLLRCYVCGDDVQGKAVLWSSSQRMDFVFVAHSRCISRAADNPLVVTVELLPKRAGAKA